MAQTLKVLGQSAPAATTLTTLYTVPAATSTVVSSIVICNRSTATTFRVAIRPAGTVIANQHYQVYDAPLGDNDTVSMVLGWSLATTDVVSVYGGTANVSFSLFGAENT